MVAEEFDVTRETAREMLDGGVVQVVRSDSCTLQRYDHLWILSGGPERQ